MTINIYSFFCLLTFIAKSKLKPSHSRSLTDRGLDLECQEYDLIYMMAQYLWGHSAKGLSREIDVHVIQDCLIVKE